MSRLKVWVAWSSGKDSAWALHVARQAGDVEIIGLLTTSTEAFGRVSMHGVRDGLVDAQAEALGLPLHRVSIPNPCPDNVYEEAMWKVLGDAKNEGVQGIVFGDLFLADVRRYRERQVARAGLVAHFPLWLLDTTSLAREMIRAGVSAYVTCLDPRKMPRALAGAAYDDEFLTKLPADVDPCGENGEFHTFVLDGPFFSPPVDVRVGETVERDGFVFTDVLPRGTRGTNR